jgi:hypothetical protein
MKKLRLNLEQLSVESFEPATTQSERGTVIGQQSSGDFACANICFIIPTGPIACPEPADTFGGPGCYRVSDPACSPWTGAGSTC